MEQTSIAHRLGWVLYWASLTLALCWILGLLLSSGDGSVTAALDLLVRRLREEPLIAVLILVGPPLPLVNSSAIPFDTWPVAELRCWQRVCMPEKRPTTGGLKCVSYWLAQLSSQLRLDLQGAFTTSKPPTLNRSRARLSNSLGGPIGMD
jgi:hypothetical protein